MKVHVGSEQVCKETVTKHDTILYTYISQSRGQTSQFYKKLALEALDIFTGRSLQNLFIRACAMLVVGSISLTRDHHINTSHPHDPQKQP
jgi:hypothetical protein